LAPAITSRDELPNAIHDESQVVGDQPDVLSTNPWRDCIVGDVSLLLSMKSEMRPSGVDVVDEL
jgi:hypothetical protein